VQRLHQPRRLSGEEQQEPLRERVERASVADRQALAANREDLARLWLKDEDEIDADWPRPEMSLGRRSGIPANGGSEHRRTTSRPSAS